MTSLKKQAKGKHSSLFWSIVNDEEKSFMTKTQKLEATKKFFRSTSEFDKKKNFYSQNFLQVSYLEFLIFFRCRKRFLKMSF